MLAGLAVGGCTGSDRPAARTTVESSGEPRIAMPAEIAPEVEAGSVVLVDVRQPEEWRAGHAKGAVHVPLGQLPQRLSEIDRRRAGRPVAFICRSGTRSAQAARLAVEHGLEPVIDVGGGMAAWVEAELAIVPANGRVI